MTSRKQAAYRASLALAAAFIAASASMIRAQSPEGLDGTWQGAIKAGDSTLRVVLEVSKSRDGIYLATLVSVDQGGLRIPVDRIDAEGNNVRFEARAVKGSFEGIVNAEKTKISGSWTQGQPLQLIFERTSDTGKRVSAADVPKRANHQFGLPLALHVASAPAPLANGGKIHFCYELHITNWSAAEMLLSRIAVFDNETELARFEGSELNLLLMRPGAAGLQDQRVIGPGMRAVAFLWISIESGAATPRRLRHRVTSESESVEGGETAVSAAAINIGPPLRGANWLAGNGPSNGSIHRRALFPVEGDVQIGQRYAIDWLKLGADGRSFDGDRKLNRNFHAYGAEALAVADATVMTTKSDLPENVPGLTSRAIPMSSETVGGNFIVLKLGRDLYAFYAHLQTDSLRVKPGDVVKRGQVLALVGNSGNSTEPHLHFHLSDGPSPLGSSGVPYVLDSYELLSGNNPGRRTRQLPLQNERITFIESR